MSTEESVPDHSEFFSALSGIELDGRLISKLQLHSERKDGSIKPEAKVRLEWIVRLVRDYGYDSKQINIEVPSGRVGRAAESAKDTVFADIVVFRDSMQKEPFVVMETKAPGQKSGLMQAESYARNLGAEYHCWHNGKDSPKFYRTERFAQKSQDIGDIPRWVGREPIAVAIPKTKVLPPFRDEKEMREVVHRCHELILEKQGHDPAKAFDELTKLLFLKLYDERETPSVYKFMVLASENSKQISDRLRVLFKEATETSRYRDVFESKFSKKPNVALELDDFTIFEVVKHLQGYSLINTVGSIDGADIKGTVFESMVGNTFRGELAQFFTPRELVGCIASMIPPTSSDKVLDPSCGSGGFLVMAIRSISNRLNSEHPNLKADQLHDKINYFATHNLFGCDINDRMARVAKMNMIMHGDGHTGIVHDNGLDLLEKLPNSWSEEVSDQGGFDIVYSNPPFAGREKDPKVLEKFVLGKNDDGHARSVSKEVLFIEMILGLLRPGGKAGLVLPAGVFNNPSMKHLRDYIRKKAKIIALVGLPHLAFQISGANNEGHLLFLEKADKIPSDYPIFIDWANEVGIDSVGKKTERNDLLSVAERFKKPTNANIIKYSELKDRIDPWHYHPNYKRLMETLKKAGHGWSSFKEIFYESNDTFSLIDYAEDAVVKYVEKNNVDLEKGIIHSQTEYLPNDLPSRATTILKENDILFPDIYDAMRGVAIVPSSCQGYVVTNRFFVVRHNQDKIILEFIKYFFNKPEILAIMKRECSGEINPGLTKDAFFDIRVPLPSLKEQERILKEIHRIESKKQIHELAIRRLDKQIDEKARTAVPRFIDNYDEIKITRAEFIGKIVFSSSSKSK